MLRLHEVELKRNSDYSKKELEKINVCSRKSKPKLTGQPTS